MQRTLCTVVDVPAVPERAARLSPFSPARTTSARSLASSCAYFGMPGVRYVLGYDSLENTDVPQIPKEMDRFPSTIKKKG